MPIHSHDASGRLKPEWIADAREEFGDAVGPNNVFNDRGAELGHALGQPDRHTATI